MKTLASFVDEVIALLAGYAVAFGTFFACIAAANGVGAGRIAGGVVGWVVGGFAASVAAKRCLRSKQSESSGVECTQPSASALWLRFLARSYAGSDVRGPTERVIAFMHELKSCVSQKSFELVYEPAAGDLLDELESTSLARGEILFRDWLWSMAKSALMSTINHWWDALLDSIAK